MIKLNDPDCKGFIQTKSSDKGKEPMVEPWMPKVDLRVIDNIIN